MLEGIAHSGERPLFLFLNKLDFWRERSQSPKGHTRCTVPLRISRRCSRVRKLK
jgi:hypothetical protein